MRDLYTDPEAHGGVSDNDFDIVEHFSEDEDSSVGTIVEAPKVTSGKSPFPSFPKALHRSKMSHGLGRANRTKLSEASLTEPSKEMTVSQQGKDSVGASLNGDLHGGNVEGLVDIANMTEEEIKEQQQFLYERLGKETCEFLIQRRLKRLEQEDQTHGETNLQGRMLPSSSDPGCCENKSQHDEMSTGTRTQNTSKHVTFSADIHELRKMEWTNPPESGSEGKLGTPPPGELWLHQLRFDFDGKLMDQLEKGIEIKHKHEGSLFNHGSEPDMPGYTIPELLELMQSSFKPQVQIATRTICNIVHMAHLGSRRYFGYSCERWFNYVIHDIDLVGKMGYVVMENASALQVLIDALRCMSILLFGDIIHHNYGKNNCLSGVGDGGDSLEMVVMPLQEMLFDLHQQDLGLDIYSWNPLATNFAECMRRCRKSERRPMDSNEDAAVDGFLEVKTREGKVTAFYKGAVSGEFDGIDVNQIKERLADAMEIEVTDEYRVQDMDSVLHLITQCDFINRLCCIMDQNKTNVVLQVYSISVICGLLMRFGCSLAGALLEAPDFMQRLEDITASLLVGTEQNKWLSGILCNGISKESNGEDLELHLATAIMCCMRLLSVFHQDAFSKSLDKIGAIALVKQTLTRTYTGHLARLLNKSTNRACNINLIGKNMVMPSIMSVRCLNVWAIQDVYKDTLDELVPVMDLEIFRLCDIAQQGGDLLKSFLSTNGVLMTQVFTHIATLMEGTDLGSHIRFSWDNGRFDDLAIELCKLTETTTGGEDHLTMLMAAIFRVQSAYVKHGATSCGRNNPLVLTEKQRTAFRAMVTYVSSIAQQFCRDNMEIMIDRFDAQWWNWQTLAGSVQPVASACTRVNGISQIVAPVQTANWMLDIVECVGTADAALHDEMKAALESHFTLLKETLMTLLRTYNKSRLASRPVPGFEKGATAAKPMPMLESWAKFILSFNQLYLRKSSLENLDNISTVASIFGALTVSCSYATIQKLVKQLYSICGHDENSTSADGIIDAYKEFNKMIAQNHTLGYANLAIVNFVAFIPTLVIGAITDTESSQGAEDVFLEMILRQEGLRSEFLVWLSDFDVANNLIQAVMDPDDEISWNPKPIFIEALEMLIFRRLSAMLNVVPARTIDDARIATATLTWDELVEHTAKVKVTAPDGAMLMSASPKPTSATEHDALGKATIGVINKFNSGLGDSPYVMAVLMLLISAFSRVDCAKKIWADVSLMVLLGRNLVLDMTTMEVTCATPCGKLCLGPIYVYLPAFNTDEEIRRSHQKLLREFNEDDMRSGNVIMAIVMSSLAKSNAI